MAGLARGKMPTERQRWLRRHCCQLHALRVRGNPVEKIIQVLQLPLAGDAKGEGG